jgi:maltose alpha-D-glucosyltransferase/alpha-amylase
MMTYWYKEAVIYGVDVDRFQDSNGDGIGDFKGLIERLDYLSDLGVTCLWVLPFYPSSHRDNGYDVVDYYAVDPRLGTLEDFIAFVRQAGERGIRVVIDVVMNHTSDGHPWFQAARRDRHSRYRDYYVWTDAPPPTPPEKANIFSGQESSVWTHDELAGAYYYHRFYHFEPDLNIATPAVGEEMQRILDFWLSFGVAGFRIDAASHLIEPKGLETAKPEDPHAVLKGFRSFVSGRNSHTVLLGEVDVAPDCLATYFGQGDELNMLLNFFVDNYLFLALAEERADPLIRALTQLPSIPESGQWANFLRNLDELDLERLTEAERDRVYKAFAPQTGMRIFGRGIRRRLAPMMGGNRRRLEMAFSILFSLPGSPVLVYGDEIGMGEDLTLEGRKAVRTPMQWSDGKHAGFSTAASGKLISPVITKGRFGYKRVNVSAQAKAADSLLARIKQMIAIRRTCPEWGRGALQVIDTDEPSVLAHRCDWKGGSVLAVHNLANKRCMVNLHLGGAPGATLMPLLGNGECTPGKGAIRIRLGSYGYAWYRLEKV